MIKVIFRMAHYDDGGEEVIAFFPELPGDCNPYRTCLCYSRLGQHGAAAIDFYRLNTRPANMGEYLELLKELEGIYGAGTLVTGYKMTRYDLEKRKEAVNHVR